MECQSAGTADSRPYAIKKNCGFCAQLMCDATLKRIGAWRRMGWNCDGDYRQYWVQNLMNSCVRLICIGFGLALGGCGGGSETAAAPSEDSRFAELPEPYSNANYASGRQAFRTCSACHNLGSGGAHRVGPNLGGVFGREVGVAPGFTYSPALEAADFEWTPERLDDWLANPSIFLPGNNMRFLGVDDPEERRDLIAYLLYETTQSDAQ